MDRRHVELDAPGLDGPGTVVRYGHYGRPVVVFPSERGRAWDYENNGMIGALATLIDEGRVKVYCVDSFDHRGWSNREAETEHRAANNRAYEAWIANQVWGFVQRDSPGAADAVVTGCSMGALHALQMALTRADLFPVAICQSGNYDPAAFDAWGHRGEQTYFANPSDHVAHLSGDHLMWLRHRLHVVLTVGQGAWEVHPTGSLPSTRHMAGLLRDKGIDVELDEWGFDVAHDWPWWAKQIAHHLPRFC